MSNTPSKAEIEVLVKRHGATSYRNRADTQHPAYGFTEDGLNGLIDEVLAKWGSPQPAPAPLSEMPYEKRKAIQEGEQIGASDAWFKARHEMLDTVDRRNVFRAGFDRGWNAALAAQGDTP